MNIIIGLISRKLFSILLLTFISLCKVYPLTSFTGEKLNIWYRFLSFSFSYLPTFAGEFWL